jgi:hypothetical protein
LFGNLLLDSLLPLLPLLLLRSLVVGLAWLIIIVMFFEPLVGNVVVCWSVFHQAVNWCISITFFLFYVHLLLPWSGRLANAFGLFIKFWWLILLYLTHQLA